MAGSADGAPTDSEDVILRIDPVLRPSIADGARAAGDPLADARTNCRMAAVHCYDRTIIISIARELETPRLTAEGPRAPHRLSSGHPGGGAKSSRTLRPLFSKYAKCATVGVVCASARNGVCIK